tara:strand:- start:327 stop:974 length:648 start_codon:yes stop_codon:yes gene_type:complete
LYLAFSLLFVALLVNVFNNICTSNAINLFKNILCNAPFLLFSAIASFAIVFIIFFTRKNYSKNGHVLNHSLWISFLLLFSVSFRTVFLYINNYDIVYTIFLTFLIFLIMSFAVYINPSFFERTYKFAITGLLVALIVIIISEIILFFYKNKLAKKYITYFAVIVFSLLISYDTIEVFNLAKNCLEYPNYPKSSLDFFITIINLFTDLLRAKSGKY